MPGLIDLNGKPMKAPKPGRSAAIARSAGSARQLWRGALGTLTPQTLSRMLREHEQGELSRFLTFAEEVEEKNEHYGAVLGVRKRAVEGAAFSIKPGGGSEEDKKLAASLYHLIDSPQFLELVEDLLDALGKGYSVVEIVWHTESGVWLPVELIHADPRLFQFSKTDARELRRRDDDDPDGTALEPYKFITHFSKLKSGAPHRSALARFVAWTYLFQNFALKDWVGFVETYGQPVRVGRYGPKATDEDINELVRALRNIGTDAAAAMPDSMKIEFIKAEGSAGGEAFEKLSTYCDKRISKAVLGQTMTTDDGSSQAQANVHDDVRTDIKRSDVRKICATINKYLIRPIVDLNFGPRASYPVLVAPVLDPEDLKELREAITQFTPMGLRVPQSYIHERWGIPSAAEGDSVLTAPSAAPAQDSAPSSARRVGPHEIASARSEISGDVIEAEIIDEAMDQWEPMMRPLIDPIRQVIGGASSYAEATARLDDVIGADGAGRFATELRNAVLLGRALGDDRD